MREKTSGKNNADKDFRCTYVLYKNMQAVMNEKKTKTRAAEDYILQ